MIQSICVAGAGTMGSGIAMVSAQSGFPTILFDINPTVLSKAQEVISKHINILVERQKITSDTASAIFKRISFTSDAIQCVADLFIEAIAEVAEAKIALFKKFASFNSPDTILATNTSSLSVSYIQEDIPHPGRVVGMHFFNPAPVMKLVEIVRGRQTSDSTITAIYGLCNAMGKTPVICEDGPGFIVNRVARHYYLEAMKLVESGLATVEEVDTLMEACGFKMGPFRLMDLIGLDINLAVTKSIYNAFDNAERFAPSPIQEQKVLNAELGRKTGKGFYTYHR